MLWASAPTDHQAVPPDSLWTAPTKNTHTNPYHHHPTPNNHNTNTHTQAAEKAWREKEREAKREARRLLHEQHKQERAAAAAAAAAAKAAAGGGEEEAKEERHHANGQAGEAGAVGESVPSPSPPPHQASEDEGEGGYQAGAGLMLERVDSLRSDVDEKDLLEVGVGGGDWFSCLRARASFRGEFFDRPTGGWTKKRRVASMHAQPPN